MNHKTNAAASAVSAPRLHYKMMATTVQSIVDQLGANLHMVLNLMLMNWQANLGNGTASAAAAQEIAVAIRELATIRFEGLSVEGGVLLRIAPEWFQALCALAAKTGSESSHVPRPDDIDFGGRLGSETLTMFLESILGSAQLKPWDASRTPRCLFAQHRQLMLDAVERFDRDAQACIYTIPAYAVFEIE